MIPIVKLPDSPISEAFYQEVLAFIHSLDESLLMLFSSHRYCLILPRVFTDVYPDMKNRPVPNDGQDMSKANAKSFEHIKGTHDHSRRWVTIPEFYQLVDSDEIVPNKKYPLSNLIMHELGHALDYIPSYDGYALFSARTEFIASYLRDIASISEMDKEALDLHLNASARSRREVFAQAVSAILFPGDSRYEHYRHCFPRCFDYVKTKVLDQTERFDEAVRSTHEVFEEAQMA